MYHSVIAKMPMMTTNLCAVGLICSNSMGLKRITSHSITLHVTIRDGVALCLPFVANYPNIRADSIPKSPASVCMNNCTYSIRMGAGRGLY
jgi:hypothetical protein